MEEEKGAGDNSPEEGGFVSGIGNSRRSRLKNRNKNAEVERSPLALVYPYTPLEENFLDGPDSECAQERQREEEVFEDTKAKMEGGVVKQPTPIGCAKAGLWNLKYREDATSEEFMRYCHRALDGAAVMLIYALGSVVYVFDTSNAHPAFAVGGLVMLTAILFWEVLLHVIVRAGTGYRYKHALMRHFGHCCVGVLFVVALSWIQRISDLSCLPDGSYAQVHGFPAGPNARYRGCINRINPHSVIMPSVGMCSLRMDIYFHFVCTFLYSVMTLLPVFGVFDYPEPEGLVWSPTPQTMVLRTVVQLTVVVLSNLIAYAKHRALERGFEGALEVHYQMRASKFKMEAVDSLMTTMVPPSALGRLMAGRKVLDRAAFATVLFSDMVQFTRWSSVRNPGQVVAMLSVLVRDFDVLAADMGVNKVKTIGDCYWAVTGLPEHMTRHAEVMINFALAMQELARRQARAHQEWDYPDDEGQIEQERKPILWRTGIHSGTVNAGILGTQQISYEIFGETSTAANQVEANGHPDRVTVSARTKRYAEEHDTLAFSFVPTAKTVDFPPSGGEQEGGDEDEVHGKLFLVISNRDANEIMSISSGWSRGKEDAEAKARTQRRRYVETHLLKGTQLEEQLSEVTRDALMLEFSSRKPTVCLQQFATEGFEEDYRRYSVIQNIGHRVAGALSLLLFLLLIFVLMLSNASGEIPAAAIILMVVGVGMVTASVVAAWLRRSELTHADAERLQHAAALVPLDYAGPILAFIGFPLWMLGCLLTPDSIVTNDLSYLGLIIPWSLLISNSHIAAAPLAVAAGAPYLLLTFVNGWLKLHMVTSTLLVPTLGVMWAYMLVRMHESRTRVQFVENKVATHFAAQQAVAAEAQQAVLASMLPDFVIEPLTAWISANFDPLKAVVNNYEGTSVAFVRLSPGAPVQYSSSVADFHPTSPIATVDESGSRFHGNDDEEKENSSSRDDGSSDWLFEGHRKVDEILSQAKKVDKVKTVGDLVIVAGSFRGHSSTESASEMLSVVLRIHSCFRDRETGQSAVSIGLHAGAVMGIVLGFSRLSFDIFGDTVNTTSRVMTAPSAAHRIMASTEFLSLGRTAWESEIKYGEVCEIAAKGKGVLRVREIQYVVEPHM